MLKSSVRHIALNGGVGAVTYFNTQVLHKPDLLPAIHPETSAAQTRVKASRALVCSRVQVLLARQRVRQLGPGAVIWKP